MKNSKNNRTSNKIRTTRPPKTPERNCITDGVYSNNYFMHAATSQVGALVKVETVQGSTYEGIFKTFSQEFDIVLELAHKIDPMDPQKLNPEEVVDNLIFRAKDIVYFSAQNTEPNYAVKGAFQIDSNISKYNGEISGEKKLQPWEGPPICNGEECDLEGTDTNQNGWDVHDMFLKNEQFGVQTSYDDSLADYTCQIHRKDTKDFKEEEAKAARIAMEIEKNPSSQARSALENGENEEELFASVPRSTNETDEKYVPPPMKRKSSQHHRPTGNNRGNYSANVRQGSNPLSSHNTYPPRDREPRINGQIMENHVKHHNRQPPLILRGSARGNQRTYNVQENPGRQQMNSSATLPRYHHQNSQQYHPQSHGNHSQTIRDNPNRSSPENKNIPCVPNVTQSQNIPSYSANMHHQQRSFSQNLVSASSHVQSLPMHQSKSQRTSPISVSTLSNGSTEYQSKQLPQGSQTQSHQYHNQNQQSQNSGNNINAQRKHQSQQHHHSNTKVREEQINELKKFGSEFNLSYEMKNKEQEPPKQIQVITSRNKSPPISQTPTERTVINVTIVPTLQQNKYTTTTSTTQQSMSMSSTQTIQTTQHTPTVTVPQSIVPTPTVSHTQTVTVPPSVVSTPAVSTPTVPTTQNEMKQHTHVISQPSSFQHQQLHLQQREPQVLMQHQSQIQQPLSHHSQTSQQPIKSTLNPNAKEFVYNPTPKSFTPTSRSPSTPTQSRPHTPQTPSGYNIHPANAPVATGIQMVMPTYVVAASPGYVPPAPLTNRLRKVAGNSHRTPEFHPSNIPVSAVTGQPLLAPSVTLAPSPLGHGTTFPIPNYSHHPQLAAQHYPHVQMIRMVQQGGMVPLVPSTISYHDTAGSNATAVYVNHGNGAAVAMAPHAPHVHHPQQHPPPSTAPSPSQTPQGPSQSHTPNNYQHPPLATQSAPPYQPIMCPVIQAPPTHGPPHHMVAAQAQPHAMQQYLQHQQVAQQPHIQVSLIPHSCS